MKTETKTSFMDSKFMQFVKKFPEVVAGPLMILWVFILIVIGTGGLNEVNPIALSLGTLQIRWYAIFILTGIIFAAIYGYYEFPKLGVSRNDLTDGLLAIVPLSIIGARLYFVLFSTVKYDSLWDVINITTGGLAIHGAIITAIISVLVFAKIKKISVWNFFDILVIGFLIGQVVGRWGNFMNQEAYGGIVSESSWVFHNLVPNFIKKNMEVNGNFHHPTFLYESFLNFVVVVGLIVIRRFRVLKVGDSLGIYLIAYGLIRGLIIEPMRTDPLYIGSLRVNVIFSIVLFGVGGILYLILKRFLVKDLPFYYDLAIEANLYDKGLEGKEYRKSQKEEAKKNNKTKNGKSKK